MSISCNSQSVLYLQPFQKHMRTLSILSLLFHLNMLCFNHFIIVLQLLLVTKLCLVLWVATLSIEHQPMYSRYVCVCMCMYIYIMYGLQDFFKGMLWVGSLIQLQFCSFAKLTVKVVCEVMISSRTSVLHYHLVQSTSQIDYLAMSNLLQCSL